VRITREFALLSQSDLAKRAGLAQGTLSAIESGRSTLGVERAKRLAIALRVHPSALLFPNWED
jgi:transcriptional regulator with XRE-family HTH domain